MFIIVELINIPISSHSYHLLCVVQTPEIYSQQIPSIQYSTVNYSHCALH